ncbi:MAG: hypothetical protein HN802_02785 [Candidatus Jacksonbacteria bacterium]|nr:hypothetical protein [Candidatus Jacksonbacteria bacterium]
MKYKYLLRAKNLSIFAEDMKLYKFSKYCEVRLIKPQKSVIGLPQVNIYKCLSDNELALFKFSKCSFRDTANDQIVFVSQYNVPELIKNNKIYAEFTINSL